ncbi:hypothetical protein C808_05267 [Lachnospiraceae bacterium M18-1]|nr:hypothetical protein C808_05267 [Lachnospiraceae bacterium M18-1]
MFTNAIPKNLYPLLSDYAKILIPSFITYLVTRYSLNRPHKYAIREKQFTLVYLPLHRLTKQTFSDNNYKKNISVYMKNISVYMKKVDRLIYKNYQFVFPKTLKLFEYLKEDIKKGQRNIYHLSNFEYQIESDYEKLKRELGYPTNSFLDFFKRLNFIDKVLYTLLLLLTVLGIYCLVDSIRLFLNGNIIDFIFSLVMECLIFFIAYIFSYSMRH